MINVHLSLQFRVLDLITKSPRVSIVTELRGSGDVDRYNDASNVWSRLLSCLLRPTRSSQLHTSSGGSAFSRSLEHIVKVKWTQPLVLQGHLDTVRVE